MNEKFYALAPKEKKVSDSCVSPPSPVRPISEDWDCFHGSSHVHSELLLYAHVDKPTANLCPKEVSQVTDGRVWWRNRNAHSNRFPLKRLSVRHPNRRHALLPAAAAGQQRIRYEGTHSSEADPIATVRARTRHLQQPAARPPRVKILHRLCYCVSAQPHATSSRGERRTKVGASLQVTALVSFSRTTTSSRQEQRFDNDFNIS